MTNSTENRTPLMRNLEGNAAHRLAPAAVPPGVSLVTRLPTDRRRKSNADVVKRPLFPQERKWFAVFTSAYIKTYAIYLKSLRANKKNGHL